jgi:hypothetical protein
MQLRVLEQSNPKSQLREVKSVNASRVSAVLESKKTLPEQAA